MESGVLILKMTTKLIIQFYPITAFFFFSFQVREN